MALGIPIGYSAKIAQNNENKDPNNYFPAGSFYQGIQTSLQGDPTLRLWPIAPPSNVNATQTDDTVVTISWEASTDQVCFKYEF
jgi:hypothetical protein